jgi:hypothetical protein
MNSNKKTHIRIVNGKVLGYKFDVSIRKWSFRIDATNSLLVACKGQDMAHKVANILAGSLKRIGKVDNLARANISQLTN